MKNRKIFARGERTVALRGGIGENFKKPYALLYKNQGSCLCKFNQNRAHFDRYLKKR